MKCPNCQFNFDNIPQITANDGGSTLCRKCHIIFHYSPEGEAHIGSPGPYMCKKCKREKIGPQFGETCSVNIPRSGELSYRDRNADWG